MKSVRTGLFFPAAFLAFPYPSGAPSWQSDWATGSYVAVAGGLAPAVVIIAAGEWYARRRWLKWAYLLPPGV